jgi:hypothetical protein
LNTSGASLGATSGSLCHQVAPYSLPLGRWQLPPG